MDLCKDCGWPLHDDGCSACRVRKKEKFPVHSRCETWRNLMAGTAILRKYIKESGTLKEALRKYSGGAVGYYEKVKREMKGA